MFQTKWIETHNNCSWIHEKWGFSVDIFEITLVNYRLILLCIFFLFPHKSSTSCMVFGIWIFRVSGKRNISEPENIKSPPKRNMGSEGLTSSVTDTINGAIRLPIREQNPQIPNTVPRHIVGKSSPVKMYIPQIPLKARPLANKRITIPVMSGR